MSHDRPAAGDSEYDGFRITDLWAWTTVDPLNDQEGILGLGPLPMIASDMNRLIDLTPIVMAMAETMSRPVTLKHFTLAETVKTVNPPTVN